MNPLYLIDIAGLLLFLMYAVHQTASALRPRPKPPVAERGVTLTFLIPAMNEEAVIAATLQNLRSTVPEARVVVIDDASADATAAIVEQYGQTDPMISLLRRVAPEAQENKGRALNWAVARLLQAPWLAGQDLSQHVLVVLDADGRVSSDFAPQVRGAFQNPDVMAGQGWMRFRPVAVKDGGVRGLISKMLIFQQDLETFIVGHIQRLRASGGVASLTGNGQCMRLSYLSHQLGQGKSPWPDVLLEDFGSVMEIVLDNPRHKVALLPAHIMQQGILDPRAFIKQRARWTQGALQCLPYLTRLWKSGASPVTRLDFTYFILSPWLNIILILSIASQLLRRVFGWQGLLLPDWMGILLTVVPLMIQLNWAVRFRNEKGLSWWSLPYALVSLPVYGAALLCSLPLAYSNYLRRQNTWFKGTRYVEQEPAPMPHISRPHHSAPHTSDQPQRSLSSGD